jgi:hypothetical protein
MTNLMFATYYCEPAKGEVFVVFLRVQFGFRESIPMRQCSQFHKQPAHLEYPFFFFFFFCRMVKFLAYAVSCIDKFKQG